MSATITPLEALRRLIAEVKQLDAVEVGARWNQLQGELGVAEGVVRDYVGPKPVGHVNHYSSGSVGVSGQSILALPHGAPIYAAPVADQPSEAAQPVPAGWKLVPIKPTAEMYISGGELYFDTAKNWKRGSTTRDQDAAAFVYHAMISAAPTAAVSAAPSGEVERECSHEMLCAAMKAAVKHKIIASHADGETYLKNWDGMKEIIRAAITATKE